MRQGSESFQDVDDAFEMDSISSSTARQAQSSSNAKPVLGERSLGMSDYAIGIGLLLLVVLLWTSSNFLTQNLFEGGYEKPFLVTYMNTSAFSLYLLPYIIRMRFCRSRGNWGIRSGGYQPLSNEPDVADHPSRLRDGISSSEGRLTVEDQTPLTTRETAQLAVIFCFFWFIANWSVNASLDFTTVASATVLSSMSGFFTLGIGRLFRVELLTPWKIGAVLTSFVGVLLVSFSDSSQPRIARPSARPVQNTHFKHSPLVGDALALLSAIFYACYVVLLKVRIRSESRIDMQLFFGFLGLFNVITCWPIGILLHLIDVEKFQLPHGRSVIVAVLINMAITLSSDYIYVIAMLKTTPLVVTVGLSLTIPLAVVGDFFLGKAARGQVILGAFLVLISFVVIGVENARLQEAVGDNNDTADSGTGAIVRLDDELRDEGQVPELCH